MTVYLDVVVLLNFLVDYLLLLGTNRLCGYPLAWGRCAVGALFGSVYGGVCLLPGFSFLGNLLWRIVSLLAMGFLSFGISVNSVRRTLVFLLLSMALGGIAVGMDSGGVGGIIWALLWLAAICFFGFRSHIGACRYVPVELEYGQKHIRLTALWDTGNCLQDPVTGRPILVVCGDVAQKLTGLTPQELSQPVQTMSLGNYPGLRLIPYSSVGQPGGLLLALRLPNVKIGKWTGSSLVAFAPNALSRDGAYEALTGGMVS